MKITTFLLKPNQWACLLKLLRNMLIAMFISAKSRSEHIYFLKALKNIFSSWHEAFKAQIFFEKSVPIRNQKVMSNSTNPEVKSNL